MALLEAQAAEQAKMRLVSREKDAELNLLRSQLDRLRLQQQQQHQQQRRGGQPQLAAGTATDGTATAGAGASSGGASGGTGAGKITYSVASLKRLRPEPDQVR